MKKLFLILVLLAGSAFGRTAYQVYRMPSSGPLPAWGPIDVSQSGAVTGVLQPANGGTGNLISSYDNINVGLSAAISSNTLVITLTQADGSSAPTSTSPAYISFRSPTNTTGSFSHTAFTATASVTLGATDSVGFLAGTSQHLMVYAVQDTTSEICVSALKINDLQVLSASALTAGADTSVTTVWCPSAHTSRPFRLIGYVKATWSNPNWGTIARVAVNPVNTPGDDIGIFSDGYVGHLNMVHAAGGAGVTIGQANASDAAAQTSSNLLLQTNTNAGIDFAINGAYVGGWQTGGSILSLNGPTIAKHTTGDFILGNGIYLYFKNAGTVDGHIRGYGTSTLCIGDSSGANCQPATVSAGSPTKGMMIVRGSAGTSGSNSCSTGILGEGYSCSWSGAGLYSMTFSSAFSDTPACTCSSNGYVCNISGLTSSGVTLALRDNANTYTNSATWNFICIGQRGT